MTATWDDNFNASDDESLCSEDDSFHGVRALKAVIAEPSNDVEEYFSNKEDDEEEDVEDMQETFDKLYIESIDLVNANTKVRNEKKELKEKSTSL